MQGIRGFKEDTGPQSPKCDEDDKGDLGYDGKTAMATESIMAHCKIIHLTTRIDDNDALNKSYVDTQTNNLLKTDWTSTAQHLVPFPHFYKVFFTCLLWFTDPHRLLSKLHMKQIFVSFFWLVVVFKVWNYWSQLLVTQWPFFTHKI